MKKHKGEPINSTMKKENQENLTDDKTEAQANAVNVDEAALPDAETAEQDELAKLEAELTQTKDKYLRIYSEFENYKKRVARDRIDFIVNAAADTMLSILPVIDDMERAIKATTDAKDVEALKEGARLVYQKMKSVTENRGLKAMESVGKPFDPDLHDAIANIPAPKDDMKGKVVEEIEKGYYLNDKVIRHAKVVVGN